MASKPSDQIQPSLSAVPLARKNRQLSFERRIKLWLFASALAVLIPTAFLLNRYTDSIAQTLFATACIGAIYTFFSNVFLDQLLRPLQTLANIVAAIREQDYSFRARGARRGDTVGDLALEINGLSGALQVQRAAAQDALTLLQRVLTSMQSPVLAFDDQDQLRVLNNAARNAFDLDRLDPIGQPASELHLDQLLAIADRGLYPAADAKATATLTSNPTRWSVRRAMFRLHGLPHTLLVLSDVAAVLREEERLAWQRLIRVLSHEINNSLTPIKSIAGSLRSRASVLELEDKDDFERGLSVIEERAASLNRFLQAYQKLTHLPAPNLQPTTVADLVERTSRLETRIPITISPGPAITIFIDPDQIQQALINLLRNAADAALAPDARTAGHIPEVNFSWTMTTTEVSFVIADNGAGIDNPSNLFVPFYTTKPQGSGIGLALSQQIAAAHHGSVAIAPNQHHRGCTATFTLPLKQLP